MNIKIENGIRPEHLEQAARLYAEAFERKFIRIIGDTEAMTKLLKGMIYPVNAITAVSSDNQLVGIAGYRLNERSMIELKKPDFTRQFGYIRGNIKYMLAKTLYNRKPDAFQLLMDGIAVSAESRSQGIGRMLFLQLEILAGDNQLKTIKLDVIDENPRAKRLYEELGFVKSKYRKIPFYFRNLIGISGVTTMVKTLHHKTH